MFFKPKTLRYKHLSKIIAIILCLYKLKKSYAQIAEHVKIPESFITTILYCQERNSNHLFCSTKRAGWPLKLDVQAKRTLICHVKQYLHNNFAALATLSKTG